MSEQKKQAIVVVEDDDRLRQALGRLLDAAGFQTETFASAEALLQSDAAERAACLVLDIHLPGLSGFELRRELVRTRSTQPPVIFITGQDKPARRAEAQALGAVACLQKPVAGRILVAEIVRALGRKPPL
jgi:FixJ family two-component response regulator